MTARLERLTFFSFSGELTIKWSSSSQSRGLWRVFSVSLLLIQIIQAVEALRFTQVLRHIVAAKEGKEQQPSVARDLLGFGL